MEAVHNALFNLLDVNRDGHISRDELKAYHQTLGRADDSFIDRLFRKLDDNHDGLVGKQELVKARMSFWRSQDVDSGYEIMYDLNQRSEFQQTSFQGL